MARPDDQQSSKKGDHEDSQALVQVSPTGEAVQGSESFEEDCRAVVAALAQRQDRHESPIELDELIREGRGIYYKFREQAEKLQKQKSLADEMLVVLGPTEVVQDSP